MQTEQLVALVVVGVTAMLYLRHRSNPGLFNNEGAYDNVSPLKHDLIKQVTLDLVPLLIYGLASTGPLWNSNDPLNSKVGSIAVGLVAYVVYYHLVEPYVANRTPNL